MECDFAGGCEMGIPFGGEMVKLYVKQKSY